jgi:drug/metabolite transporter (DMT)-like permease
MILSGTLGVWVVLAGVEAVTAVFWRCALALPLVALYALVRGAFRPPFPPLRLWMLAGLSGLLFVADWVALFAAYPRLSVGTATLLLNLYPFITLALAALLLGERPGWTATGWIGLGFIGFLLTAGLTTGGLSADPVGVGLVLLAAVTYAAATLVGRFLKEMPPLLTTLVQMGAGVILLAPAAAMPGAIAPAAWPWLLLMAAGPTALTYVLMNLAFGRARLPVIAVLSFLYPLTAVLLDGLVFGVVIRPLQAAGGCLILLAAAAVTLKWPLLPRRLRTAPPPETAG